MASVDIAKESSVQEIDIKTGVSTDSGATASTGTEFGKINKIDGLAVQNSGYIEKAYELGKAV